MVVEEAVVVVEEEEDDDDDEDGEDGGRGGRGGWRALKCGLASVRYEDPLTDVLVRYSSVPAPPAPHTAAQTTLCTLHSFIRVCISRPPRARPTVRPAGASWAPWLGQLRPIRAYSPSLHTSMSLVR